MPTSSLDRSQQWNTASPLAGDHSITASIFTCKQLRFWIGPLTFSICTSEVPLLAPCLFPPPHSSSLDRNDLPTPPCLLAPLSGLGRSLGPAGAGPCWNLELWRSPQRVFRLVQLARWHFLKRLRRFPLPTLAERGRKHRASMRLHLSSEIQAHQRPFRQHQSCE